MLLGTFNKTRDIFWRNVPQNKVVFQYSLGTSENEDDPSSEFAEHKGSILQRRNGTF